MALPFAVARKTSLLLNSANNFMTSETRTEITVVSTTRSSTWKAATECLLTTELVVSMRTATDSTILLMRSVKHASNSKTSSSYSVTNPSRMLTCAKRASVPSACWMRRLLSLPDSVTRVSSRVTNALTSVHSSLNLNMTLNASRFKEPRCGEKSLTLRLSLIRNLEKLTNKMISRNTSMPTSAALTSRLMTLPV